MPPKKNIKDNGVEEKAQTPLYAGRIFRKSANRESDEEKGDDMIWLLTFADIMALMLTFFVLMYSMSTIKEEKWEKMTSVINKSFEKMQGDFAQAGNQETIEIEKLDMSRALALDYLQSLIVKLIEVNPDLEGLVMFLERDRLVISLPAELLFESGKAQVNVNGKKALFSIVDVLARIRNSVEVIGHSDPRPITGQGGAFSSNRELSLHRALSVAGVMNDLGYERQITARGLSFARYEELSGSVSEAERLNLSRRVDIVVLKNDGTQRFMANFSSNR